MYQGKVKNKKEGCLLQTMQKKEAFLYSFAPLSLTKDCEAGVKKTLDACMNARDKQLGLWENGNLEMHVQVVACTDPFS